MEPKRKQPQEQQPKEKQRQPREKPQPIRRDGTDAVGVKPIKTGRGDAGPEDR
jgi:hypothetical protein